MNLQLSKQIFDELVSKYSNKYEIELSSDGCISMEPCEEQQSGLLPALQDLMKN